MGEPIPWPEPQPSLSRPEVLTRLCKILSRIYLAHDAGFHEANDCFCDRGTLGSLVGISTSFRHSGQSIEWLEKLVDRELGTSPLASNVRGAEEVK